MSKRCTFQGAPAIYLPLYEWCKNVPNKKVVRNICSCDRFWRGEETQWNNEACILLATISMRRLETHTTIINQDRNVFISLLRPRRHPIRRYSLNGERSHQEQHKCKQYNLLHKMNITTITNKKNFEVDENTIIV